MSDVYCKHAQRDSDNRTGCQHGGTCDHKGEDEKECTEKHTKAYYEKGKGAS